MRTLILWVFIVLTLLLGVLVPGFYYYGITQIPTLETEFDLENLLRVRIEGDRLRDEETLGAGRSTPIAFVRPELAAFPKDFVNMYLIGRRCPTFFETPRETGWRWLSRLFRSTFGTSPPGDGVCEYIFARRLAMRIGVEGTVPTLVATHRIHSFLEKDQLVAYELASTILAKGVIGPVDGSQFLMHQPLEKLSLADLAELRLAFPPFNFVANIKNCTPPVAIRDWRDRMLGGLAVRGLATRDRVSNAQLADLNCSRN